MTRVTFPGWLREEVDAVIKKQMHVARMLQARLVDPERRHEVREARWVHGQDIVKSVKQLDALAKTLDSLIGGGRALRAQAEDMRHTMEFAAYCDREFAYQKRQNG